MTMEEDIMMVPDIFMYLNIDGKRLCYYRVSAKELLDQKFDPEPKWIKLRSAARGGKGRRPRGEGRGVKGRRPPSGCSVPPDRAVARCRDRPG